MKAYKVLTNKCGSCIYPFQNYKICEWTYPTIPHSKLFVFDTLENALKFGDASECIWECEVENPTRVKYVPSMINCDLLSSFWLNRKNKKASLSKETMFRAPEGTLLVDKVKITKLIYGIYNNESI